MGFDIRFDGLGEFSNHLDGIAKFAASLQGDIAHLSVNPDDPGSVEGAVKTMEAEIDRRLAPFRNNATAVAMAEDIKRKYAAQIRGVRREPESA